MLEKKTIYHFQFKKKEETKKMTSKELFKKYEQAFSAFKIEDMIETKKEWIRQNPNLHFYEEYTKYVKEYWSTATSVSNTKFETLQIQDCKEDSYCSKPNNNTPDD